MSDDLLSKAHELSVARKPYVTAVVVRAERPTSGKPGDRAIVTEDGRLYGWIGGSCARPTVLREAAGALADGEPRLIRLSPDPGSGPVPEGVREMAMTCFGGGTLDIFIQPRLPAPRLLVVGHLPVAHALARLGAAAGYEVVRVDPTGSEDVDGAHEVLGDLSEIESRIDPSTYVVVATHGAYDEPALGAALRGPAPYVGLVSSRSRAEAVLAYLQRDGVDDETLARVRVPAGLDLGARDGTEIAISILAEIVQLRGTPSAAAPETAASEAAASAAAAPGASGVEETAGPAAAASVHARDGIGSTDPTAGGCCAQRASEARAASEVDPVCGMEVAPADAMHTHDHDGRTYYFCCGGCRARFSADPAAYLTSKGA